MSDFSTYWWSDDSQRPNLGDVITPILLDRFFSKKTIQANLTAAELMSTGSILGHLWDEHQILVEENESKWLKKKKVKIREEKLFVVGSGFIHPWIKINDVYHDFLHIISVRGFLTKNLLSNAYDVSKVTLGDPGLLLPKIIQTSENAFKKYKYGVIPHHSRFDDHDFWSAFDQLESVCKIDFRTNDIDLVARQMLECDVILSQSLHGLIFADSLGIQNVWIENGIEDKGGAFKFYDYFSSIDRPFSKRVIIDQNFKIEDLSINIFLLEKIVLEKLQCDIEESFFRFFDQIKSR
ncbi:MAG: polysaccharide pyruvyl transferase family protein [Pseudomonadota bacterium]|nr:polysaccharide pyruvyl transferase family protein [Pseudomonadota bacterium]MEC8568853.1 polysaccharide pyruvyl transferase family protein [Pseudomonadota bacterium]